MTWRRIPLQPLDFEQSKQLIINSALKNPILAKKFPDSKGLRAFMDELFRQPEIQGVLEMGGGVPGILTEGAKALAHPAVLPTVLEIYKDNAWDDALLNLAVTWTGRWVQTLDEFFKYPGLVDRIGVEASKQLLLLVLSGVAVHESQQLSGCVLSDVLALGSFYVSELGKGSYSVTLPGFLLQLFYGALSSCASPGGQVFSSEMRESIRQLIRPQVKTHREMHGDMFEVMAAAQLVITCACWKLLGFDAVTLECLFRPACRGIPGGYLPSNLASIKVELRHGQVARDTVRLLTAAGQGGRKWGEEEGNSGPHRFSQLKSWMKVPKPAVAASVSLLDPENVVLLDTWRNGKVQPVPDVDIRATYMPHPADVPILLLWSLKLRKGRQEDCSTLSTVRKVFWPFVEAASKDATFPFQPVVGVLTTGKINEAALEEARDSGEPLLILADEACMEFMPVLRHRPILRGVCADACPFNTRVLQELLAANSSR